MTRTVDGAATGEASDELRRLADELGRTRARLAMVEDALENERQARWRAEAQLTLERMHVERRATQIEPEASAGQEPPRERLMEELERSWGEIQALRANRGALHRRRWWHRA